MVTRIGAGVNRKQAFRKAVSTVFFSLVFLYLQPRAVEILCINLRPSVLFRSVPSAAANRPGAWLKTTRPVASNQRQHIQTISFESTYTLARSVQSLLA